MSPSVNCLTLDVLRTIHATLDFHSVLDTTFWAACMIAFYGMLRKSSLLPPGHHCHLRARHVTVTHNGAIIHFHYSKTVQFKQRVTSVFLPMASVEDKQLCPVRALLSAWLLAGVDRPSDPLLPLHGQGGLAPLSAAQFTSKLMDITASLGLSGYSAHSFRRGGASHALACGVPAEMIKAQGDWRSMAYLDYLDLDSICRRANHIKKMV